jgi:hypothetical protein
MKLAIIAAYMKAKYGQDNFLPEPQDEPEIEEAPDTSRNAPTYEEISAGPVDTSLGVDVPADRAQSIKDRLIRVYDDVKEKLTQKPYMKELYRDLEGDSMLDVFNKLIDAYVVNIANSNLKDAFLFGIKYVDGFNDFINQLPRSIKDHKKMLRLADAVVNIQKDIWWDVKNVLNFHDIGRGEIPLTPEERKSVLEITKGWHPKGTWYYGPGRNPSAGGFKKNKPQNSLIEDPELRELARRTRGKGKNPRGQRGGNLI